MTNSRYKLAATNDITLSQMNILQLSLLQTTFANLLLYHEAYFVFFDFFFIYSV